LLFIALINVVHVSSSYNAFKYLNPSIAQSFFYTYPFINLLLSGLILDEQIAYHKYIWVLPIIISLYFLYASNETKKQDLYKGIPLILIAALTESIIYISLKKNQINDPWVALSIVNGLSAIIYSFYYLFYHYNEIKSYFEDSNNELYKLILINIFIGIFGYVLRFLVISKVSSLSYSIFSYSGIIINLILSSMLLGEIITPIKVISILVLILSLIFMKIF
jgi:drug/metabolite transporter (DMT)-like permease